MRDVSLQFSFVTVYNTEASHMLNLIAVLSMSMSMRGEMDE